jgi:hypothetical protein
MWLFSAAILAFCLALFHLREDLSVDIGGSRGLRASLTRASSRFRELEDLLSSGLLPPAERWAELKTLGEPWGDLAFESLTELRSRGGALLPTLRRLRGLADEQSRDLLEGRARSSSALAQALTCAGMAPLFSLALYFLMPGLSEHRSLWLALSSVALGLSALGALWLVRMAESARWAGLSGRDRPLLFQAYCAGEKILAQLRSGQPPDIAWSQALETFRGHGSGLSLHWSPSIWAEARPPGKGPAALLALVTAGESIRKAIQCSLMEGRPSADRIESAVAGLRSEVRAAVERELSLLSTRALKPLFLCVAPSLLGLLASGVAILWLDSSAGL